MPNYAENVSQRTPCLLVLDASTSMSSVEPGGRSRIDLLNEGIATLHAELAADELALSRVQIGAINVGGFSAHPQMFLDWTDGVDFQPFPMKAGHNTPLGEAMLLAMEVLERQKATLRSNGISYTKPWVMVLTDGAPTDTEATWRDACARVREYQAANKALIFPIGIGEVDISKLSELSTTPPMRMQGLRFRELFIWLSGSLSAASRSAPGAHIDLPSTDPWASVRL
jgi:uncharacterized protein YegL